VPAVPAVDSEIAVRGDYDRILVLLGHPHEASVGKRHWHVGIATHQFVDRASFILQAEVDDDYSSTNQVENALRTAG